MSYTPTEWKNGDTITATAMNKIENGIANAGGIATVKIVWEDNVTVTTFTGTTNGQAGSHPFYSINGGWIENISGGYRPIQYLTVPILTDGNQAIAYFSEYTYTNYDITSVGKTLLEFREPYSAISWNSEPFWGYIIEGDTTITVTPK